MVNKIWKKNKNEILTNIDTFALIRSYLLAPKDFITSPVVELKINIVAF